MKTKLIFVILILALTGCTKETAESNSKPDTAADAAAAKRTLNKLEKEHLKKLVADNQIVACVTLGPGSFNGFSGNLHAAKVTTKYKGKLPISQLLALLDESGQPGLLLRGKKKNPLPKIAPGDYVVIVLPSDRGANSFPTHQANYHSIQLDGKKHCAWEKNSPEAVYVRQLCGM